MKDEFGLWILEEAMKEEDHGELISIEDDTTTEFAHVITRTYADGHTKTAWLGEEMFQALKKMSK